MFLGEVNLSSIFSLIFLSNGCILSLGMGTFKSCLSDE